MANHHKRRLIEVDPVLHVDTFGGAPGGLETGIAEGKIVLHDMLRPKGSKKWLLCSLEKGRGRTVTLIV